MELDQPSHRTKKPLTRESEPAMKGFALGAVVRSLSQETSGYSKIDPSPMTSPKAFSGIKGYLMFLSMWQSEHVLRSDSSITPAAIAATNQGRVLS